MPRFTFDMDDKFNETLSKLAEGGNKADVIRKAVASYQYLKSEVPSYDSTRRISIRDVDGTVLRDVILP